MADILAAWLIGIAGGVHCVGMCGGVIAGLSYATPKQQSHWPYTLSYSAGRILSYSLAGFITGSLGMVFSHGVKEGLLWLNLFSGLFLLLLAGYIGNWWRVLRHLEQAGGYLWRHVSPIAKRFIPFATPLSALPYGFIWGWLPCGLVYSTLSWSLASGSGIQGALVMLAFGVGTLPATLLLANGSQTLRRWITNARTKQLVAILLLLFALHNIAQVSRDLL